MSTKRKSATNSKNLVKVGRVSGAKPGKVSLSVSFSADQICGDLLWSFKEGTTGRNLLLSTGRQAGAVHFRRGETVIVEVHGTGPKGTFVKANVKFAHLVSIPHTGTDGFSAPSPFSEEAAVVAVEDWGNVKMAVDPSSGLMTSSQRSRTPLLVTQKTGRWGLSLVLSIQIQMVDADGVKSTANRVFSFDPEAEVGTGTDPD
ncbi:MAG: hypothetical protein U1A22_11555 [Xanthomonadaceae bacterium]|nr:hypothetical protein [Xanthomonadaceae bacterium]